MRRRSGQSGQIVRKGNTWHVRFYVDVPGQRKRQRKSVVVGPAVGKEKLTKPEAARKAAEIVRSAGVNTAEQLENAVRPQSVTTFQDRVGWCRRNAAVGSCSVAPSPPTFLPRLLSLGGDYPLTGRSDRVVHRVGSQVCSVWPRDRAQFDTYLSEVI